MDDNRGQNWELVDGWRGLLTRFRIYLLRCTPPLQPIEGDYICTRNHTVESLEDTMRTWQKEAKKVASRC